MNHAIFHSINALRSPLIDELMHLASRLGSFRNLPWLVLMLVMLAIAARPYAGVRMLPPRTRFLPLIASLLIGYAITALLVFGLKPLLQLPRPYDVFGKTVLHALEAADSPFGFPSGHAAFAMLVAATFWQSTGTIGRSLLVAFALWVGLSRINLGMHFPGDVIAGYAAGLFGAWSARRIVASPPPRGASKPAVFMPTSIPPQPIAAQPARGG